MEERERRLHLATLRATPSRLRAALKGVPKAVARWTPAPGKWSILEIACHLRDMEKDAYLARYRRLLAEDEPLLPDVDGDVLALERDYRAQKLADVVREWTKLRRESLRLLSEIKSAQWARRGTHETAGPLTVADLLRRHAVGNDEAHLAQIDGIKRRHALLERLSALPGRLARALRSLSADALRRPARPGKWSAVEIACHLRDLDRVYAERVTKVAFSDRPVFWVLDNDRVAETLRYRDADAAAVLKDARRGREDLVALLRSLPHRAWSRAGLHPERGELTIERLAAELADHDAHHLQQIEALASGR